MSEDLKPCPFCGSFVVFINKIEYDDPENPVGWYAGCAQCGIRSSAYFDYDRVIQNWNRRHAVFEDFVNALDDVSIVFPKYKVAWRSGSSGPALYEVVNPHATVEGPGQKFSLGSRAFSLGRILRLAEKYEHFNTKQT